MVASQASVRSDGYTQTQAKEQRAKIKNQKSKIKNQRSKASSQSPQLRPVTATSGKSESE
jgi:hypothetical protein